MFQISDFNVDLYNCTDLYDPLNPHICSLVENEIDADRSSWANQAYYCDRNEDKWHQL